MKLLFALFAIFSFSASATCPKGPYTGDEAWKLREKYAEPELRGRVYATNGVWVSLKKDNEGKAEDSSLLMSYVYRPTPSIMANLQERLTLYNLSNYK